jgi:hypothetical protein
MLRPLKDWSDHGWYAECQHKKASANGKKAKQKAKKQKPAPAKKSVLAPKKKK